MKKILHQITVVFAISMSLIAFQNCRIEIVTTPGIPGEGTSPTPAVRNFNKIEYFFHGGFAPQALFTRLTLNQQADGTVLADLTTESCQAQTPISANDFLKIEIQIVNSPRRYLNPNSIIADAPSSYVVTTQSQRGLEVRETLHLSQLGVTGLYLENGALIEQSLRTVVDGIKKLRCAGPLVATSGVRFQRLEKVINLINAANSPTIPEALDVDLTVKFSNGVAYLSGHIARFSKPEQVVPDCRTDFPSLPIGGVELQNAANMITYGRSQVVCLMAAYLGPVRQQIPVTMTSIYQNGSIQQGYLGCEHQQQAQNSQAFLQILDRYLEQNDRCASNPVLVRVRPIPVSRPL